MSRAKLALKAAYTTIIAGVALAIFAIVYSSCIEQDYLSSQRSYAAVAEDFSILRSADEEKSSEEPKTEQQTTSAPAIDDANAWYNQVAINLTAAESVNSDIIGWIYFENLPVSYPVLYSGDNSYYLNHRYDKKRSAAGAIFLDADNHPNFSDSRSIIYGHNTERKNEMFTPLEDYKNTTFLKNHPYFQIITTTQSHRYEITSAEVVADNDPRYVISAADRATSDHRTIILSTCYAHGAKRLFITARRTDVHFW